MKKISALLFLVLAAFSVHAQKRHELKSVKGEWVVSNDITLPQAREKAINEAKLEALRMAGVPEYIGQSNISYTAQTGAGFKDLFESIVTLDVYGEIAEYKIAKEEKKFNDVGNIIYDVWIDATVIVHKDAKDSGFGADISGIRSAYTSPDDLLFQIKPWKDAYMHVFLIAEGEGTLLYPSRYEQSHQLIAGKSYSFPSKGYKYEVTTERETEVNYVLIFLTKTYIPFKADGNLNDILRYISGVNPGQKFMRSYSIVIHKQQ